MMNKKIFLFTGLSVGVLIIVGVAVSSLFGGKNEYRELKMTNNKIEVRFSVSSNKDGFLGTYFGSENVIKLSDGKHTITIDAEGYETIKKDVSDTESGLTVEFKKQDAKTEATKVVGASSNIANAKYFAENTWMVIYSRNNPSTDDGSVTVSKKVGDKWSVVSQGTAIDVEYLVSVGAPADLVKYLGGF